jgi:hypothetical protein
MQLEFWSVVTGLVTATIGVVAAHRLTASRERGARRSAFRGFLGRWVGRTIQDADVAKLYSDSLEHLWGYYGQCYRDFYRTDQLRDLCQDLGSLLPEDIRRDSEKHRKIICRKLQALIDFV